MLLHVAYFLAQKLPSKTGDTPQNLETLIGPEGPKCVSIYFT